MKHKILFIHGFGVEKDLRKMFFENENIEQLKRRFIEIDIENIKKEYQDKKGKLNFNKVVFKHPPK